MYSRLFLPRTDCWHQEPHQRPTFAEILQRLSEIATSPFMTTPQESFHTMQEDWRLEIEEMFNELRLKEKVPIEENLACHLTHFFSILYCVMNDTIFTEFCRI